MGKRQNHQCCVWYAVVISVVTSALELPELPEQWTATIEANIAHKNYTIHMREWHDALNDQGRTDLWSGREGGPSSTIYQFENSRYFHTNSSGCFWGTTDQLPKFSFMASDDAGGTAHLTTTAKLWAIAGNGDGNSTEASADVYMGQEDIRGVACDWWKSQHDCVGGRQRSSCDLNYTLDWYFSQPAWNSPESASSRIPIRIELKGTRLSRFNWETRSPVVPPQLVDIWHVYDYVAFHVGTPASSSFERPCGAICTSTNKSWDAASLQEEQCPQVCEDDENDAGGDNQGSEDEKSGSVEESCDNWTEANVAGLAVSMLVVGIIVGAVLTLLYMRLWPEVDNPFARMAALTALR